MKKRYACVLVMLVVAAAAVPAESVWTGNAAVGSDSDFPGESDSYRAASNSFPTGTILKVVNPRGGRSVEVTVIGRLETPGVFVLIEDSAAAAIGLPDDHVIPVRVTPLDDGPAADTGGPVLHSGETTDDGDYNLASSIPADADTPRLVYVEEPAETVDDSESSRDTDQTDEAVEETAAESTDPSEAAEIIAAPDEIPEPAKIEEKESLETKTAPVEPTPGPEPAKEVLPAANPETILVYDIAPEEKSVTETPPENTAVEELMDDAEESGIEQEAEPAVGTENDLIDPERTVFFLMPSDLRPPDVPEENAGGDPKKETVPSDIEPAPARTVSAELHRVETGDAGRYIQIGSYRNRAVLEETAARIAVQAPGYPLSMADESVPGEPMYKLLIGPLTPAETGIVLKTARASAFPDAFPYAP